MHCSSRRDLLKFAASASFLSLLPSFALAEDADETAIAFLDADKLTPPAYQQTFSININYGYNAVGALTGVADFVCDNISFSDEIKFARKHTRSIVRDLPQLVSRSIDQLMEKWHPQDKSGMKAMSAALFGWMDQP